MMGWWSTDILGGDTPLDCLGIYEAKAGVPDIYPLETLPPEKAATLRKNIEADDMAWLRLADDMHCEHSVAVQVGALIAMTVGARLSAEYRLAAISAILEDEWAAEGEPARVRTINGFAKALARYTGTPTRIHSRSLFEAMAS
jgi:hypothetical protein